ENLLQAHRLYRRHQGTHGEIDPRRPLSRAHRRKGDRAHAAARAARPRPARQSAVLSGRRASAPSAAAGKTRRRGHEPPEQEDRIMAETVQSLEELSTLKPAPAPATPTYVQVLDKQGRAYATGKRK